MKIKYNRGLIIESNKGEKIFLDPELSSTPIKNPTLVTHAHSDHTAAVSGGSTTYLTKITKDLIDQSLVTDKRLNLPVTVIATVPSISDEVVAKFTLTLSVKTK